MAHIQILNRLAKLVKILAQFISSKYLATKSHLFAKVDKNVKAIIVLHPNVEQIKTAPMIGKAVDRINVTINVIQFPVEAADLVNVGTKNQEIE